MSAILISLSPNTEADDVRLAGKVLLQPHRWYSPEAVPRMAQEISRTFLGTTCLLTASGRSALYHVLQAFEIGRDDEVIVQAFTCVAVPAAVTWCGATPVFADIDETYNLDLASVRARITPYTRAIVVQHTFGIPANMPAMQELARTHNVLLIEDCAHALGAEYQGKPLGTWGDAAILSFGRDKAVSSVFGGAVLVRDPVVAARLRQIIAALPLPPRWWVAQQLLHPIILSLVKRFYFIAGMGKALLVIAQQLRLLSKAVEPDEKQGGKPAHVDWQFSPALALLLERQWSKVPRFTWRRRAIVAQYATQFSLPEQLRTVLTDASWLRFPVRVDNPRALREAARTAEIMLGDWYDSPVAPADVDVTRVGYQAGSCPRAEAAAETIVNLPTHPTMTDDDVVRVRAFMQAQSNE